MKNKILILFTVISALFFNSCVDREFDTYKEPIKSELKPTLTIKEFINSKYANGEIITDTVIIKGTVISSDKESNFYKELFIQDKTGGIKISIERYSTYLDHWVGNDYVIILKGLIYNTQYKSIGVKGDKETRIPSVVAEDFIKWAGKPLVTFAPKQVTTSSITSEEIGTLVTIKNVEINDISSENKKYKEYTVEDATGTILMHTSNYASFVKTSLPTGKVNITGVITEYTNSKYIIAIRNLKDITKN